MESIEIKTLISLMSKIPGLGPRSARRAILTLLQDPEKKLIPLAEQMLLTAKRIKLCNICGNIDVHDPCLICKDDKREIKTICIVEEISDLWAIERAGTYKGRYHVLGGVLSAIDGITAEDFTTTTGDGVTMQHENNYKALTLALFNPGDKYYDKTITDYNYLRTFIYQSLAIKKKIVEIILLII